MTQKERALLFMRDKKIIDQTTAAEVLGIQNLRARITELRKDGHVIYTHTAFSPAVYCFGRPKASHARFVYGMVGASRFRVR